MSAAAAICACGLLGAQKSACCTCLLPTEQRLSELLPTCPARSPYDSAVSILLYLLAALICIDMLINFRVARYENAR